MGSKQPKLILRESCVDDLCHDWPATSFVEMGAGTGGMTKRFLERGFTGACHDLGADSRQTIRHNLAQFGKRIEVVDELSDLPVEAFDYLFAFEVLEHIENDREVFAAWLKHLKPGGRILLSVPAHARKYGRSDELVGHVRRYEKEDLRTLLEEAGCSQVQIVNYGFPLTELTRRVSNRLVKGDRSYDQLTPVERSIRSAQRKPKIINRFLSLFSDKLFVPFQIIQRWFYQKDWGDGYVATAIKPATERTVGR